MKPNYTDPERVAAYLAGLRAALEIAEARQEKWMESTAQDATVRYFEATAIYELIEAAIQQLSEPNDE